ncbi:MAG: hypothetical protein ACLGHG_06955 [Gammaproteobacteria bacterium]
MADFYQDLDPQVAMGIERLARLAYELREARAGLLRYHDVADEAALLARIAGGQLPEHPAWEHYLAASIMEHARQATRMQIAGNEVQLPAHLQLKELLETEYAGVLPGQVVLTQDALIVPLPAGVQLTVRWAAPDEYSFAWQNADGSRQACIDTAPLHPGMTSHLHLADGRIVDDPVTHAGAGPEVNLRAVLTALIANPNTGLE